MLPSREYTPAFFPFQTQPRWINGLLWRGANRAMNLAARGPVNRGRRTLGLPPLRNVVPHVMSARPIVAADAPLAPVPADCGMPCDQIPCLHPTSGDPLPSKLESFLEQGPAPIFLGFGSMTDPAPERTTDRLLEAISRRGCRALISRGWAGLGNAALPEGVLAIDPVSHARLFPRVAAVIHHGGAGTTHTAARAGVPQIIVPHILDQFYFARRVENLGIAPPSLPRTQLTVPDLVERIDFVLDNELLSDAAHHLGAQLARLNHVRLDPERLAESAPLDSPA